MDLLGGSIPRDLFTLKTGAEAPETDFEMTSNNYSAVETDRIQQILTPCPPSRHCRVCEGRIARAAMGPRKGAAKPSRSALWRHQGGDLGQRAIRALRAGNTPLAVSLARQAGTWANLALNEGGA